jgi:uncharacterized protein YjiK
MACNATENYNKERYPSELYKDFLYDFSAPDRHYLLPSELVEISGLTNYHDTHVLAVQDEKGFMYQIDLATGELERKIKFAGKGDYEGIEYADGLVSVVKSNGNIYQFEIPEDGEEVDPKHIKTSLKSQDEIEGLGYLPEEDKLLLINKVGKHKKLIPFNASDGLGKKHAEITHEKIEKFVEEKGIDLLTPLAFKPSGVAVHPITNDLYVLAHTGKCILILNSAYDIQAFIQLNPSLFSQPEGICFTSDGTLYISNEGNFSAGDILKFNIKSE